MDSERFWILDRPKDEKVNYVYATVTAGGRILKQEQICGSCGRPSYTQLIRELQVELFNHEFDGFVWTDTADIIIERKLTESIKSMNLTGISFQEVCVNAWWLSKRKGDPVIDILSEIDPPKLDLLVGSGHAKALSPNSDSNQICEECKKLDKSLLKDGFKIDTSTWDRGDLLYIEEFPAIPIISDNFSKRQEELGIENYSITNTEEFISF